MRTLILVSSLLVAAHVPGSRADSGQHRPVVQTVSVDKTKLLHTQVLEITSSIDDAHVIFPIAVSNYATVRVTVSVSMCGFCEEPVRVNVFADSTSATPKISALKLDSFLVDQGGPITFFASRTYDIPGERLRLTFNNAREGLFSQAIVQVFGRAN
jgi:hypothetical protein